MSLTVPGIPIYGIAENGALFWYHHRGFRTGKPDWTNRGQRVQVGQGWHEGRFVFKGDPRGGDGVIYRVDGKNDLLWYKHLGFRGDQLQSWQGGKKIGEGWQDARLVFSGGSGILYMVNKRGELRWYRHEGYSDGSGRWARTAVVGDGWNDARDAFSPGAGVVYLVDRNGDLYWYRHEGYRNGSSSWSPRRKVGTGWNIAPDIFSGGEGIIYTMRRDGGLYWYEHTGWATGETAWNASRGNKIGSGWDQFVRIF